MSASPPLDCAGVVLAGGRSSRMGREKAALPIDGEPLLARVVGRVREALGEVLVVGPESLAVLVPGVRVVPDCEPGIGPLGGLATALSVVETSRIFLVACDMPFLAPPLAHAMAQLAVEPPPVDALLLRGPRGLEYLHAIYATSCLPAVERVLVSEDRSMRGLVAALRVREVPADWAAAFDPRGLSTFNANTPETWKQALVLAREDAADEEGS